MMTLAAPVTAEAELYVPVCLEGAAIRDQVATAKLMLRRPVGYLREFLEAYQPGETFYLPEALHGANYMRWDAPLLRSGQQAPMLGIFWGDCSSICRGPRQTGGQHLQPPRHQNLIGIRPSRQGKGCHRNADDPQPQGRYLRDADRGSRRGGI